MESKVTSKTSSLKALIIRAWRERWSDLQWGINIKTILPRGVSGDVHNLADCILQQALVGPGPNELVLSYLKHSLCSQLVSYAAVLQRISKYTAFSKPHCIASLLEFLETIHVGITCRGKPEEDLLAAACLSIVHWLLQCYLNPQPKSVQNTPLTPQPSELMDKSAQILKDLLSSDFICAMLYSAKHDNKELYHDIVKRCQEIEGLQKSLNVKCSVAIEDSIKKLLNLEIENEANSNFNIESVTFVLQPLIAIQNIVNPSTDTSIYIYQFQMIQRLKNYSNARLYCEIMRASMMCLLDVTNSYRETHWGAFTVLKLPQILRDLHISTLNGEDNFEYSQDIIDAFELLLRFTPLLDKMDIIYHGNSVECTLAELVKVNLVTEKQAKQISSKRDGMVQVFDNTNSNNNIRIVIIRAEPTLLGFLKTMNAEYAKIQEGLLSMLSQGLTGNSFDLMLAVALVDGKMKTFVSRLIKINECSMQISDLPGKVATTRSLLFEISFLMLCSLVQTYGPEIVLDEGGDSFFEKWVRECMPLRDKPKSPNKMLENVDVAKVDALLTQVHAGEVDLKTCTTSWSDAAFAAMGVAKEMLVAWESGVLSAADVKRMLNNLKSSCCLPVCFAAWLCAYMATTHQDGLLKPMNMVQQLLTTQQGEDLPDHYKERSVTMFQIIRKMQYEIHPPNQAKTKVLPVFPSLVSKLPILEQLQKTWNIIYQKRWMTIQSTQVFELLLRTGGPLWFVTNLVNELLKVQYRQELQQSIDLIFALFHLDIENCTIELLNKVLPPFLYNSALSAEKLVEPKLSALAKLCVYCIYSTLEYSNMTQPNVNLRKRIKKDPDTEEIDLGMPAAKLLRLNETGDGASLFTSNSPQNPGTTNGQRSIILRDPLSTALSRLFENFDYLAGRNDEVSQNTYFILKFLKLTVQCGKERARIILRGMPQTLVPNLLKLVPEFFTTNLLLQLYDVQTTIGRKAIARDLCMLRNIRLKPTS